MYELKLAAVVWGYTEEEKALLLIPQGVDLHKFKTVKLGFRQEFQVPNLIFIKILIQLPSANEKS